MTKAKIQFELVPARLRGETLGFDLMDGKKVVAEAGRRINAKHVRQLDKAGITKIEVPDDFLLGKVLAHDLIDKETGEAYEMLKANDEITEENIEKLLEVRPKEVKFIYTNDLDRGPYISNTLRIDQTSNQLEAQVEIYRMMRPGEPPTKEAAQTLFNNCLLYTSPSPRDGLLSRMPSSA